VRILLYAPQNFNNLCMIARTLDVFGFRDCHVFDPKRLVRDRYGRRNTRRITNISSGAFAHIRFLPVEDPVAFVKNHAGRRVATVVDGGAVPLADVRFRESDLIVLGSEVDGLPPETLTVCDLRITIPQIGTTQSLNLAVAAGIVLYECIRQVEGCAAEVSVDAGIRS
jgi:tRNA G18 (ribose-2'-O)-methylase SpoU